MAFGDRDHGYLYGREPYGEGSGVVFDQHAEEALDRSVEGAVDHERLLAGSVFGYIFEIEALRQVEVELHGRELPEASDGVHQFDIDLRAIESCFAGHNLVRDVQLPQRTFQGVVGQVPLVFTAEETLFVFRIPGGKLGLELVEAEGLQHGKRKFEAADDFSFNLVGSAEDVSVVLGKAADAEQAVHHSRTLVTIDGAELAQAHRQIAIRLQRIFVDENVAGTVHRLEAIFGVVEFHGVEHVLRVVAFVARGKKQLAAGHVRRYDERIAASQVLFAHPVFHLFTDDAAFGMPKDEARSGKFLDREQVELLAQHAMVALLRLFNAVKVGVEILL